MANTQIYHCRSYKSRCHRYLDEDVNGIWIFPDKQFGGDGYNYKSLNKADSTDAIGPVTITAFDGVGKPVELWTLKNAFLKNVGMGEFAYDDDSMVSMDIEVRYDWATIEQLSVRAPYNNGGVQIPNSEVGP